MTIEFDQFSADDVGTETVLGVRYTVFEVDDLRYGDEELSATVDIPAAVIYINKTLDPQAKRAAVIHEIVHIWNEELKLGLSKDQIHQTSTLFHQMMTGVIIELCLPLEAYRRAWVTLFDELRTATKYGGSDGNYPGHLDAKERMSKLAEEHEISVWDDND